MFVRSWQATHFVSTIDFAGPSGNLSWPSAGTGATSAKQTTIIFLMASLLEQRNLARFRSGLERGDIRVDIGQVLVAHILLRIARHRFARMAHLLGESFPREGARCEARAGAAISALSGGAVAGVAEVFHEERLAARDVSRGRIGERRSGSERRAEGERESIHV